MTNHLKSNVARFPSETIEGETILIDSEKGVLLLLVGSAPWIWTRFDQGADRDAVIAELAAAYGASAAAECSTFIESMIAAELLGAAAEAKSAPYPLPESYTPPSMETFEDISEIIMMDPIHEVDPAAGWPNRDTRDR